MPKSKGKKVFTISFIAQQTVLLRGFTDHSIWLENRKIKNASFTIGKHSSSRPSLEPIV
jgi:hypothetical protein